MTNADIFKVEPLIPYSKDYYTCLEEAKERTKTHNAPIKEKIPDITEYDLLYIGIPVYWGGMPEKMFTALKDLDFNGKVIRPFVTHEGSGLSAIPNQLKDVCKGAIVKEGLAVQGSTVNSAKDIVNKWINS